MTAETFFKELKRLISLYPKQPTFVLNSVNSDYANQVFYSENVKYAFDSANCTECAYIYDSFMCVNCVDCDYVIESQLIYDSTDAIKCFNCNYLQNCISMNDSDHCVECTGCHDVFGCVRLRNKAFCIFNRQLTEEQYRLEVEKYKKLPLEKIFAIVEELKLRYPKTQTNESNNENSNYGDYFFNNKNCYLMFDASHNENSAYMYDSFHSKMCMDSTYCAHNELDYQTVDSARLFNSNYIVYSNSCVESSYIFDCFDVKNSLGCVKLDHKQYCILNRQLTKEDYERESQQILEDIRNKKLDWADITFR